MSGSSAQLRAKFESPTRALRLLAQLPSASRMGTRPSALSPLSAASALGEASQMARGGLSRYLAKP